MPPVPTMSEPMGQPGAEPGNDAAADPVLTIGYSVLGPRAAAIRLPELRPDVEILIVVQGTVPPGAPVREDVRYLTLQSVGVARSRNHVLAEARGEFVLFADDDIVFQEEGVRRVLGELRRDDNLALALAAAVDEHGQMRKRYPRRSVRLHRWNSAKAATYEMMLRREAFSQAGLRFDERFGAGAELYLGDEYILIADALRAGLSCRFFPYVIAVHPSESSGSRSGTVEDAAARAAVFTRVFGAAAPVARLAFLLRAPRRYRSPRLMARFILNRFAGHPAATPALPTSGTAPGPTATDQPQ